MATKKETFNIQGKDLTQHEKLVFEKVLELGQVDYNVIATNCNISTKSAIATLARLEKTHGLLTKNEPVKAVSYQVAQGE